MAVLALLGGCAGSGGVRPPPPAVAEIAEAGPDCLADEVLAALFINTAAGTGSGRSVPAAGSIPPGFDPVRVVECRSAPVTLLNSPASATGSPLTIVEVVLEGDLAPLIAALSRPSDRVPADVACIAMFEFKPQIYLVDAQGGAVRPQWPVTACGFLHDGAAATLSGLSQISSTERVVAPGHDDAAPGS